MEKARTIVKKFISFANKHKQEKYFPLISYEDLKRAIRENPKLNIEKILEPTRIQHPRYVMKEWFVGEMHGRYGNSLLRVQTYLSDNVKAEPFAYYVAFLLTGLSEEVDKHLNDLETFILEWVGKNRVKIEKGNQNAT